MPGYDPACGIPYAKWLQDKGVNSNSGGLSRTDRVVTEGVIPEGKRYAGQRFKVTRDELGGRIRERDHGQDVRVNAPCITGSIGAREVRDGVA